MVESNINSTELEAAKDKLRQMKEVQKKRGQELLMKVRDARSIEEITSMKEISEIASE